MQPKQIQYSLDKKCQISMFIEIYSKNHPSSGNSYLKIMKFAPLAIGITEFLQYAN